MGDTLPSALRALRWWQTRTQCCGHIVAHDCFYAAQTGKHLLRTQNVSERNQKHFLCLGHKFCVRNKCCARGQTGKHLCPQHCVFVCHRLYGNLIALCLNLAFSFIFSITTGDRTTRRLYHSWSSAVHLPRWRQDGVSITCKENPKEDRSR